MIFWRMVLMTSKRNKKLVRVEKYKGDNDRYKNCLIVSEYSFKGNFNGFVSGLFLSYKQAQEYANKYWNRYFAIN